MIRLGEDTRLTKRCVLFLLYSARVLPQVSPSIGMFRSYIVVTGNKDQIVGKTVFVPLTDDLLYNYPERIVGPVIPFTQQARLNANIPVISGSGKPLTGAPGSDTRVDKTVTE